MLRFTERGFWFTVTIAVATASLTACGRSREELHLAREAAAKATRLAASMVQDPASRPSSVKSGDAKTTGSTSQESETEFARFRSIGEDEGLFETAIVNYLHPDGTKLALISSVHIADLKHYEELNKEFERYDALLYELVAPSDYRPRPGERSGGSSPISFIQTAMKKGLQLAFQLDGIDYSPDNFVHADLTPSSFETTMKDRGESIVTIMMDMMARSNAAMRDKVDEEGRENAPGPINFVRAFQKNEGRHRMRMTFAQQLTSIEELLAGGGDAELKDGKPNGTTLLEGRNDRALEVLREQMKAGKRNIGIYYGAAHMPDFEKKLLRDFGYKKTTVRWLQAWDLHKRPDKEPKKR